MEIKEIYDLMDKFQKSNITEMNLDMDSVSLHLKKNNAEVVPVVAVAPTVSNDIKKMSSESLNDDCGIPIKAPLVGTFYRASSPDAKPFVLVGQKIKKGDVVAIIEAMKLMNEVLSPADGVVTDILASDEALVQYDEVLIKIKES